MIRVQDITLSTTNNFILYESENIIGYNRDINKKLNDKKFKIYQGDPLKYKELILKNKYLSPYYPILENMKLNIGQKNLNIKTTIKTQVKTQNKLFIKYASIFDDNLYFYSNEIIQKFNIIDFIKNNDNILTIGKQPYFLEHLKINNLLQHTNNYFIHMNKFKNSRNKDFKDLDIHPTQNYYFLNKHKKDIKIITFDDNIYQLLNLNVSIPKQKLIYIHYYRNDNTLNNGANTYMQLYYITFFIFALENLLKGGKFIIYIILLTKKILMDLYVIAKDFFKSTTIYKPNLLEGSYIGDRYIVFEGFKGLNTEREEILDKLKKELKKIQKLYPNDIDDFNIYEKEVRTHYNITKPLTKKTPYLDSLLNISHEKRLELYDDIKIYNNNQQNKTIKNYEYMFTLLNIPVGSLPNLPTVSQINKSIIYLKKNNIEFNDYSKDNFILKNEMGRSILYDLYGLHQPIIYKFKTSQQNYTVAEPKLKLTLTKSLKLSKKRKNQNIQLRRG
jgi:hypothetical protein